MFDKSLAEGTDFSKDIISNIAQGDIAKVGSIGGERGAAALSAYMGYRTSSSMSGNTASVNSYNTQNEKLPRTGY